MTIALLAVAVCTSARAGAQTLTAPDADGDGHIDAQDNCPRRGNPDQADGDHDGVGDACEPTACLGTTPDVPDGLGASVLVVDAFGCSIAQQCPCDGPRKDETTWRSRGRYLGCVRFHSARYERWHYISAAQRFAVLVAAKRSRCGFQRGQPGDRDGDGIPDDGNGDGILRHPACKPGEKVDCDDNCPRHRNPGQANMDLTTPDAAKADGRGDVCDNDVDGDGRANRHDDCPRDYNPAQEDGDNDEVGDECDDCKNSEPNADVDEHGCD